MQFARNLAEGRGFAYNPGVPVSGSTAPLWTLALGGDVRGVGTHPVLAKALGIAATPGTAWLAGCLALIWAGRHDARHPRVRCSWRSTGPMVWGALSGMEVALAALLVTATLCSRARARLGGRRRARAGGPRAAGGRSPAAALLAGGPAQRAARGRWRGAPVAGCLAPWVAFNLVTIGSPLPARAAAKIEGGLLGYLAGVHEPLRTTSLGRPGQFRRNGYTGCGGWTRSCRSCCCRASGGSGATSAARRWSPASVLLPHPLAMALLAPYRAPSFQEGRYSIHLFPLALASPRPPHLSLLPLPQALR